MLLNEWQHTRITIRSHPLMFSFLMSRQEIQMNPFTLQRRFNRIVQGLVVVEQERKDRDKVVSSQRICIQAT